MSTDTRTELRSDVVLAMPAGEALDGMRGLLHVDSSPDAAFDEPIPVRLVVGPSREMHVPFKRVEGEIMPPHEHGNSIVFPLHWEPVGYAAAAYPSLEANIAVTPIDDETCLLSLLGRYTPPFGAVGAAADRVALSRIAQATADAVVARLAKALQQPSPPGV